MWKLLFKNQKMWTKMTNDLGLERTHAASPVSFTITLLFVNPRGILSFPFFPQGWTKKAEQIHCPALLPEHPAIPLLTRMLVSAPYQAPEKKAKRKGKEAKSGLRRKGASDVVSEDTEIHSSPDEDEGEEEESNSPLKGGKEEKGGFHGSGGGGIQERENLPYR